MICATCIYFYKDQHGENKFGIGICRRFPPSFSKIKGVSIYPIVEDTTPCCGEFSGFGKFNECSVESISHRNKLMSTLEVEAYEECD